MTHNTAKLLKTLNDAINANGGVICQLRPELYFPEDILNWREKNEATAEAKLICKGCEVFDKCFTYAVVAQEPYGIWAGMTSEDRKALRRKRIATSDSAKKPGWLKDE